MGALAVPAMIGAGIGGGASLLRGKGIGGILQGAALGGAGGAITGGATNLFNTGSLMGANAAGAEVAKNAIAANAAAGIPGFAGAAGSALPGAIESSGMVFNPSTGTYLNPEYYVGASTPMATYTGGEGLLANATGNFGSSIPQSIKDYATPQNLLGVAQVATQDNRAPMQMLPAGQVSQGRATQFQPFNTGTLIRR
jgi:hypothetical protein